MIVFIWNENFQCWESWSKNCKNLIFSLTHEFRKRSLYDLWRLLPNQDSIPTLACWIYYMEGITEMKFNKRKEPTFVNTTFWIAGGNFTFCQSSNKVTVEQTKTDHESARCRWKKISTKNTKIKNILLIVDAVLAIASSVERLTCKPPSKLNIKW